MNLSKPLILFGFLKDQAKEGNFDIFVGIFATFSVVGTMLYRQSLYCWLYS